jgi:hypothetical protein
MDPRTRYPNSSPILACLALLTGCNLSFDPSLIRSADAGPGPEDTVVVDHVGDEPDREESAPDGEAPWQDAEALRRDAEVPRDASAELDARRPALDASGLVAPDFDAWIRDAQHSDADPVPSVDAQVRCSRDSECAADSFCTAGTCSVRCDAYHGCVGPVVPPVAEGMAADGDSIYWSTPVETDSLGNPLNHGRIWSWRHTDALTAVVQRESGTLLFVIDDYIYLRRPAALGGEPTVLMRKSLGMPESPAEQLATNVRRVWKTRDHVVWSRVEAANQELWRLSRLPASSPERALITTTDDDWMTSNATFAVKAVSYAPSFQLVIVRLADQVVHGIVGQVADPAPTAADEDYLYFARGDQIKRVPFSDLSQELILGFGRAESLRCEPSGGWLYWDGESGGGGGVSQLAGRTQRDALVPMQPLLIAPPLAAVIKNDLFYFHAIDDHERRIFIKTMPPLPCSSAMPCPADMSCGANMFCE